MPLPRRRVLIGAATLAVAASAALGVGVATAVSNATSHSSTTGLGALPSFLPKSAVKADSTMLSTVAKPALTSEGDAIRVELPHGYVTVTVDGPVVPGEGLPYRANADTATWTVTMKDATQDVPISTKAFSTIDSFGAVYQPGFVPGQPRPPAVLKPGHTARFELRVVMAVGEGMMRWAPVNRDLLGTWDFVVEND